MRGTSVGAAILDELMGDNVNVNVSIVIKIIVNTCSATCCSSEYYVARGLKICSDLCFVKLSS